MSAFVAWPSSQAAPASASRNFDNRRLDPPFRTAMAITLLAR